MKRHAIAFTGLMVFFAFFTLALALVFDGTGTLQVDEVITMDAFDVNVSIGAAETIVKTTMLHNSGTADVLVSVAVDVLSDTAGPYIGLTVNIPNNGTIVVPAQGSAPLVFEVVASNGVPPGSGKVVVSAIRP